MNDSTIKLENNCKKNMSFEECEELIIKNAVKKISKYQGKKIIESETTIIMVDIIENFLRNKKRICYGGTAINNILPYDDQFYDKTIDFPDYDFFSPDAINDAKRLSDIFYKKGFIDVEAKTGVHYGTYKVFVNFIPVADITQMNSKLFNRLKKSSKIIDEIYYAPPNYLRMSMYLELSRPKGDVSRWEKISKRLNLLNKNYPLRGENCTDKSISNVIKSVEKIKDNMENLFYIVRDTFINKGYVFFGTYANTLYLNELKNKKKYKKIPDFDILAEDPLNACKLLKEQLEINEYKNISYKKKAKIDELISNHYEFIVDGNTVAYIYEPLACHNYNIIHIGEKKIRIATIDTILSFYLAFIYSGKSYHDVNRILCVGELLFKVQRLKNHKNKILLRRFSIRCYGDQQTRATMRKDRNDMFYKLQKNKDSKKYESWFLKYMPHLNKTKRKRNVKRKVKKNKTRRKKEKK